MIRYTAIAAMRFDIVPDFVHAHLVFLISNGAAVGGFLHNGLARRYPEWFAGRR